MRIAIFSDVHGDLKRLNLVLNDIAAHSVDKLVCLGDVATLGPEPWNVLERLRGLKASFVQGNHDEFLLDPSALDRYATTAFVKEQVLACRNFVTPEDLTFLSTFVPTLRLEAGGASILFFHGTPRSNIESVLPHASTEDLRKALDGFTATFFVCAHTHFQFMTRFGASTIINPGSVGMPFEEFPFEGQPKVMPFAEYAILDVHGSRFECTFRRIPAAA
jgi:putative phosphoesterase